jgi:hypothetical protein
MNDSMHDIVKRLAVLEGRITPTYPSGSQNPQQKSVHQLPALFKPGKGGPILGGDPNKKAVTKGYFVGAESDEHQEEEPIKEAVATEEKLLDKVKKSFIDYLDSVEDAVAKKKDQDIGNRAADKGISKKAKDQGIVAKNTEVDEEQLDEFLPALGAAVGRALVGAEAGALTRGAAGLAGQALGTAVQNKLSNNDEVNEDPTQSEPPPDTAVAPIQEPTYAAQSSAPVKTVALEDGRICEIHGNEHTGFEIRHGNRRLPSRFKNLDHAVMATEMWQARQRSQRESADYIDEA